MGVDQPKPQRMTKKHQQHDQPQGTMQSQEINHPQQDNYLQGPHNTTTYMNLPNSMQNKICGRCGSMGHIKRMCKEEVYCRYCKAYTHSTTACRTYPVTSSRKNTPEKRTVEDIEREVSRRVQEEMKRILNDLSTSRRVASTQQILQMNQSSERKDVTNQALGQHVQNLIGDFQRPPEVFERVTRNSNRTEGIGDQILNQQWDEPPHMQPPMIPTTASTSQAQYTAMNTTSRKVEMPAERTPSQLDKGKIVGHSRRHKGKDIDFYDESASRNSANNRKSVTGKISFSVYRESVSTPTGHRRPEQINGKQCPCCSQLTKETPGQEGQHTAIRKRSSHTGREDSVANEVKSGCETKEGEQKGSTGVQSNSSVTRRGTRFHGLGTRQCFCTSQEWT